MHVVAAGPWDLALSALDRWARVDRADRAVQEGRGVQAGRVAPANRAVQAGRVAPANRAVQADPGGLVVRDAPVRAVDDLRRESCTSSPFGGLKPDAGSPPCLVDAVGNVLRGDTQGRILTADNPSACETPANKEDHR